MRAVVQRVTRAAVRVDDEVVGAIDGPGLCVLVGIGQHDTEADANRLAETIWRLRIFADDAGDMNVAASDLGAPVLVVSQFTLYADTSRGRRPSWVGSAPAAIAEPLVAAVADRLRSLGARVENGRFGAHMHVELVNNGPVTILLDTGATA